MESCSPNTPISAKKTTGLYAATIMIWLQAQLLFPYVVWIFGTEERCSLCLLREATRAGRVERIRPLSSRYWFGMQPCLSNTHPKSPTLLLVDVSEAASKKVHLLHSAMGKARLGGGGDANSNVQSG
jgi:hypothetical protein